MKRLLGVMLLAGMFSSLFACAGGVMDGGGMINKDPVPVLEDYAGLWVTEEVTVKLVVEEDMASVYVREGSGHAPKLVSTARVVCGADGALTAAEGDKIGFYSSIFKDGRLLYAADADTGEVDVLAHSRSGFRPDSLADYDGIWYTRDSSLRLEIKNGRVRVYANNGRGDYRLRSTGTAELWSDGSLADANGNSDLAGYSSIMRKGRLLHASVPVMDASGIEDVFARAGHSEDFPPLPSYVKSAEEVPDRTIRGFAFSVSAFDRQTPGAFPLSGLPGLENAAELRVTLERMRSTGERRITGSARDGDGRTLLELDYPLTDALEQRLAALLLSEAVLRRNPSRDTSDMARPTVYFTLEASFASGGDIAISTAYGIPIGPAAADIAALLLSAAG